MVILTRLLNHSTAKQLQRTAEQTHYSGSVLLTHTNTQDSTVTHGDFEIAHGLIQCILHGKRATNEGSGGVEFKKEVRWRKKPQERIWMWTEIV